MLKSNSGFASTLIILLFLFAGIGIGLYLVKNPTFFKPHASENRLCIANSPASFQDCINKVNWNQADIIEVQSMITCQKADNCQFRIANVHRSILIHGKKGCSGGN